jgi:hypothetical protein
MSRTPVVMNKCSTRGESMDRVYRYFPIVEIFPEATVAPELFVSQQPSPSKWEISFWGPDPSIKTEMRWTDTSGTNRAGSRVISRPFTTQRQILPIPVALLDELPIALTMQGGIGLRLKKSDASGKIWMVAPESRMNGPALAERVVQEFVFNEEARKASVDMYIPLPLVPIYRHWMIFKKKCVVFKFIHGRHWFMQAVAGSSSGEDSKCRFSGR